MSEHPFSQWLATDRTGPAPVPSPDDGPHMLWLHEDGGYVRLWCHHCTTNSGDVLREWPAPVGDDHAGEITAAVLDHMRDKHADKTENET